jgi:hypothetical protein
VVVKLETLPCRRLLKILGQQSLQPSLGLVQPGGDGGLREIVGDAGGSPRHGVTP